MSPANKVSGASKTADRRGPVGEDLRSQKPCFADSEVFILMKKSVSHDNNNLMMLNTYFIPRSIDMLGPVLDALTNNEEKYEN